MYCSCNSQAMGWLYRTVTGIIPKHSPMPSQYMHVVIWYTLRIEQTSKQARYIYWGYRQYHPDKWGPTWDPRITALSLCPYLRKFYRVLCHFFSDVPYHLSLFKPFMGFVISLSLFNFLKMEITNPCLRWGIVLIT